MHYELGRSVDQERGLIELIVKAAPSAVAVVPAWAARIGISLQALHPGTSDPELATYFVAHVEAAASEAVLKELLRCGEIEGAYAKPRGEPP